MSSSGITPLNSGPLLFRTYLDGSSNNSYALGAYDKSISSNRILITSTAGLIAPSDNIYISSISISSINGLPYPPVDDALWSLVGSTVVNDNPGPVQITSSLICSSITNLSSIFAPGGFNISSLQGTYIAARQLEYRSQDASTLGTFKIELNGSNLLVFRSTLNASTNTHVMNNGGSKLVLGTNNPVIFINGPNDTNNYVGIATSTPQYTLDIAGKERIAQFGADTATADATLIVANSSSGRSINFLTNCTAGAYNSIASAGDLGVMFNNSTIDTGNLWIGPWASGIAKGIKILTNGNVGIGEAQPGATLQVAGTLSTNTIVDNSGSSGTSGQVLTAGAGGLVVWGSPAAGVLASGTATFIRPNVTVTISLGFQITTAAIIQLTWYDDNGPTTQNAIYTSSGTLYMKQAWWNPLGAYPTTSFQIQIGPAAAGDGPDPTQIQHLIKWAILGV